MVRFPTLLYRTIILMLVVGASILGAGTAPLRAQQATRLATAYAVGGGELIAFDAQSGTVLKRIGVSPSSGWASPDLLADPRSSRLYLLGAPIGATDSSPIDLLSVINTTTWKVLAQRHLPHRLEYILSGASVMALSADDSRLFVYSTGRAPAVRAHYWLAVLDARTLKPLRKQVALPHCGAGELAAVPGQIAVLCHGADLPQARQGPSELRFVDARRLVVTASIRMSTQSYGLVVSPNQKYLYVDGGHLTQVDASHHRVVRDVDYLRTSQSSGVAPFPHGFDVTPDGGRVILGLLARRSDPTAGYAIQQYALPGLHALAPVSLPFVHFVAAPGNQLITFPMLDSPTHDWQVSMLDLQTGQSRPLFTMNGPVLQLVVSRAR